MLSLLAKELAVNLSHYRNGNWDYRDRHACISVPNALYTLGGHVYCSKVLENRPSCPIVAKFYSKPCTEFKADMLQMTHQLMQKGSINGEHLQAASFFHQSKALQFVPAFN